MQQVDLSKYKNDWYQPGSKIKILAWYILSRIFINTSIPYPYALKCKIIRMFGGVIGKQVVFKQNVTIKYPWFLSIDDNSWIGENVWIDNLAPITIGKNCCLSQGAMLLTGNHDFSKTTFDLIVQPINLADGAWVGAQSVVCPGVNLESHALLAVGSVATKTLEGFSIYQGNPAVFKRKREVL